MIVYLEHCSGLFWPDGGCVPFVYFRSFGVRSMIKQAVVQCPASLVASMPTLLLLPPSVVHAERASEIDAGVQGFKKDTKGAGKDRAAAKSMKFARPNTQ